MMTMNRIFLFCSVIFGLAGSVSAGLPVATTDETGHLRRETSTREVPADEEGMVAFFKQAIAGKDTVYDGGSFIPVSEVAQVRKQVWEAWCRANKEVREPKLIGLEPLEQERIGKWRLPRQLEPYADLMYYWGTKGEKPENGFPMFVYLHGSGHKNDEWATGLALCRMFDDAPSAYFIPQIPNMGEYYRWWQKSKQFAWKQLLRQAFVTGQIDANKVYFFGISEGGYGSQRLASFYADYLAAAGPMAGGEPLKNAPAENCRNIGFSLLTGSKDAGFYRNQLTEYVRQEFDSLQQTDPEGYAHRVELIPGMGHGIDYRPTTPWLKQFTRQPHPKKVVWEQYDMDGWYRDGFYNLYIVERTDTVPGSRTRYVMEIRDNRIDMTVDDVTYTTVERDPHWGIELKFTKQYQPAKRGKFIIYLNENLVDLSKKITVRVNGRKVFSGKLKCSVENMVNSCAAYYDPERLYPAAVEVEL